MGLVPRHYINKCWLSFNIAPCNRLICKMNYARIWWHYSRIRLRLEYCFNEVQIVKFIGGGGGHLGPVGPRWAPCRPHEPCYQSEYNAIFHAALYWLLQDINPSLSSQKTLHSSPSRVSYGVSIVRILEKTDHVITASQCICYWMKQHNG